MEKKRSSNRLSSFFFSTPPADPAPAAAPSESTSRLTKAKNRLSSVSLLPSHADVPAVPPVPAAYQQTIRPVDDANADAKATADANAPLQPPPPISSFRSRSASPGRLNKSRPTTPAHSRPSTPLRDANHGLQVTAEAKKLRRKSRLFSSTDSSSDGVSDAKQGTPQAWVVGHASKVAYNLTALLQGEKVPELWDEQGDTLVYLFPRTSDKGASFRIDSSAYAASQFMTRLVHGRLYSDPHVTTELADRSIRNSSGTLPPSRTGSPDAGGAASSDGSKGSRALSDATEDDRSEKHLYVPIALSTDQAPTTPSQKEASLTSKDIDTLVTYRNFFAFLIGQSLVATPQHPEIFDVFLRISDILSHYNFSNVDSSTFGEVAATSFDSYVDELNLADVRHSREKTIEAIVLGEKMRSVSLYTEGFVHAVGKYQSIKDLSHPKFELVSAKTGTRMARAALDLETRERNINVKLSQFEFPAIFAGLMDSAMSEEKKMVRFGKWKSSFMSTRSFAIDYYKAKYGGWLPKARSKKNNLTTSGLNRLVLRDIFSDLSDLYDLLVDRSNLTNRTADGFMSEDERNDFESVSIRALRKVLSEYDRSTPPVQPPIPFDVPIFPSLRATRAEYPTGNRAKDAKLRGKKLRKEEIVHILSKSFNPDAQKESPFLAAFRHFELKQVPGCTAEELFELRAGQWLFLYAVLQSLPMLVVDAPGVRFTKDVEYFLCMVPRSGVPWAREDTTRTRTWFGVAGGSHVVSLPTDVVEHGVEGVFRRSHCWTMAEQWAAKDTLLSAAMHEMNAAPLPPPPSVLGPAAGGLRPQSRGSDYDPRRESVMNLGLEALPLPPGIAPGSQSASPLQPSTPVHDPNKTFDSILGPIPDPKDKSKKKKK